MEVNGDAGYDFDAHAVVWSCKGRTETCLGDNEIYIRTGSFLALPGSLCPGRSLGGFTHLWLPILVVGLLFGRGFGRI